MRQMKVDKLGIDLLTHDPVVILKDLEGKRVEVRGWRDAAFARNKVVEAQERFIQNKLNPEAKPVPKD